MEKKQADGPEPALTQKRKPAEIKESPESSHKRSKLESDAPKKQENEAEVLKGNTFDEKYSEFLKSNQSFFEALKHENSVLLVKNSPQYSFGNYSNYYGLRYLKRWEDDRVKLIKPEWVKDRKCLDIGCNEGVFTILLAVQHSPKVIVGCDIDYTLINKAIAHIRSLEKNKALLEEIQKPVVSTTSPISEKRKELVQRLEKMPKSFTLGLTLPKELMMEKDIVAVAESKASEEVKGGNGSSSKDVLDRLIFRQENYIAEMTSMEKYDTIFCLSTAKWIHLHYGDTGIKALFFKVYKSLSEGGIFVLEPQPWKSYKKKKHLAPELKEQYKKIKFLPNQFEEYLVDVIGFKVINKLLPEATTKKGYNRPIFVLQK